MNLGLIMVLFNFYYQFYSSREPVKEKITQLDSLIITIFCKILCQKNVKTCCTGRKYLQMTQQTVNRFLLKFLKFNENKTNYTSLKCVVNYEQSFDYYFRRQIGSNHIKRCKSNMSQDTHNCNTNETSLHTYQNDQYLEDL